MTAYLDFLVPVKSCSVTVNVCAAWMLEKSARFRPSDNDGVTFGDFDESFSRAPADRLELIAFHGSSGVLEVYAFTQGVSVAILGNAVARAVIVGLFAYLSRDQT
jgi:hypothetical protein